MEKRIILTISFVKYLNKLKKHFSQNDIINSIKNFYRVGLRKGETKLHTSVFDNVIIDIYKLRIRTRNSTGRYLLGIIDDKLYIPIFIDLKTGQTRIPTHVF